MFKIIFEIIIIMSLRAAINGYTSWSNMRLTKGDCDANNILKDILQGTRMKVLLQQTTGHIPKGLDSMDKLTPAQKVIRVDWFVDALKKSKLLPSHHKVDSTMFSLSSADHIFPVLWELVCTDVVAIWEIAPVFQQGAGTNVVIAKPLLIGPCKITKDGASTQEGFYFSADGQSVIDVYKRRTRVASEIIPPYLLIKLINGQLKMTVGGKKIHVKTLEGLVDSRVLCCLVNSLIPDTFTSEVLLNDRWTINLALETASKIFRVTSLVDSHDISEYDEEGLCAFLTYFIASGYQFRQAQAVLKKIKQLQLKKEDLHIEIQRQEETGEKKKTSVSKLSLIEKELSWIESIYDIDECKGWIQHAEEVQSEVRVKISKKMAERFDVITVSQPMSINDLVESMVINLSLTGGNGLYHALSKEKLWPERRIVIYDNDTGNYYEDFSGRPNPKGSVRKILGVHPHDVVEVNPATYPKYKIFFESASRNKILKGGTCFLYQVFPGTLGQCERLLLKASSTGEKTTVQKLVIFFSKSKDFVNCRERETGNTPLHLASRHGQFETVLYLLESGADVNRQNNAGCTPLFLSTDNLHKRLSQLLLEWGANINIKNKVSKKALELTRNMDLREFLEGKYEEYKELSYRLEKGDSGYLEEILKAHLSMENPLASLRSRCVKENTLFHTAVSLGSKFGIEVLLGAHIDTDILNASGTTPLQMARDPAIIQTLIDHGANVNTTNVEGNTALHLLCCEVAKPTSILVESINTLVSNFAQLDIPNQKGWLPIHCAAAHGLIPVMEALLALDKDGSMNFLKEEDSQSGGASLVSLSLEHNWLQSAQWLSSVGYRMKKGEADDLLLRILNGSISECDDAVEIVGFLLGHGANSNAEYSNKDRPLHISATLSDVPEIGELLLGAGAEVDAKNITQATPLFNACKFNNPTLAKMLIEKGADCHATDVTGKCAFDYVMDHEEWIDSGHFSDDIRALLKAFSLRYARDLIQSISRTVKTREVKL